MSVTAMPALRQGHNTASGLDDEDGPTGGLRASASLEAYYKKYESLRGIPPALIRKAWFTMAHLLVAPGATVIDMGCTPQMTYAMAILNPQINFIGIDPDKKTIGAGQKHYTLPNLEFRQGDIRTMAGLEAGSVDAIVNSFILHEIFSTQKYSERAVASVLESHFYLLKPEGLMFVRDYAMPPQEEFVLLEMPDSESRGDSIEDMAEPDLLLWFSEHARPQGDRTCTGFFLEELPPRFPQTRLFRVPYKWAYEFIMRKDERDTLKDKLSMEFTYFTPSEFRKTLRGMGARVLYSSPQWDDSLIRERFEGRFRLYTDEGKPLPMPATSFIAVAQKMGEKKSLLLNERRPSHSHENKIRITAMRNDMTGQIFDIVTRDTNITEIIPYRVTENGVLNIFIHEGLPRGIANAIPRIGQHIDGKRWSGHMTEAIAVPSDAIHDVEEGEPKAVVLFARDYLGLKPAMGCALEKGPVFYPAPDFIDEQIQTRYLRVAEHEGPVDPRQVIRDIEGFTTKGRIREIDAQSVLDAISVGLIPNVQLETQILRLYDMLGMKAETWVECPLALESATPDNLLDTRKLVSDLADTDKRFKDIKGTAGQLRAVKSIFVDEGWVDGGVGGLASRDIEFVLSDDQTVNKAVILPLTKDAKSGVVMAGVVAEYLPIPQRHNGNGLSVRAPSVILPKEVTSIDDAKRFIAAQFDVPVEKVARLGESYFCHLGVTPVRIFPFCVATTGDANSPLGGPVQYAPLTQLLNILFRVWDFNESRFIVERYKKVFMREFGSSEVTGDWVMNAGQVYDQTMNTSAAVMNATNATGLGAVQAAPAPAVAEVATGLAASGWSTKKSREKTARDAEKAASTYTSTPDFVDIRHAPEKGLKIGSKRGRYSQDHNADHKADSKGGKKS